MIVLEHIEDVISGSVSCFVCGRMGREQRPGPFVSLNVGVCQRERAYNHWCNIISP